MKVQDLRRIHRSTGQYIIFRRKELNGTITHHIQQILIHQQIIRDPLHKPVLQVSLSHELEIHQKNAGVNIGL